MIRVYSTLTRTKEPLETVEPGKVGMYLCGPTVYKPSHIGHMVGPVIFDTIKRYLVYSGYKVTFVVNVTDVDDKLIAESNKRGMSMAALAEEMTADYMSNIAAMGVDTIDHFPRCTENIGEIVDIIKTLVSKGFAYASDGDVYFDVTKDPSYGKLSNRATEEMQGEGGSTAELKRNAADFALWKKAKPGEPFWDSPWGPGRPGWHIECSAMARRYLGKTFDFHGGGLDLIFPHHENEIAQSESAHDAPMARYWLHNGLMQASDQVGKVGGRATRIADGDIEAQMKAKISKSTDARPFRELLAQFTPETIRFFLLATHYRRPIDYGLDRLKESEAALDNFYRFIKRYQRVTGASYYDLPVATGRPDGDFDPGSDALLKDAVSHRMRFLDAMDDDFNTGGGMGDLFELLRRLNKFVDDEKLEKKEAQTPAKLASLERGTKVLREISSVLGLFRKPPPEPAAATSDGLVGKLMLLLIDLRAEARKKKDFATADQIRKRLTEIGVTLEDRPSGTEWTVE
jgi:cysteinyl-tRNA synthetase